VAAHECGHAIQDGTGYLPMKLRAGLLPIVNLGAQLWFPLFFAGIVMGGAGLGQLFIQLAVLAFAGVRAFHVVTLPVEFDASRRAYGLLTRYGLLSRHEAGGTKRVLKAAAFTYVAAALTSLLTLLYLILVSRE
jgi:Zn-dependent membrane protease YugP